MNNLRNREVGVVDYRAGNIQSIENAILTLGARTRRVANESDVAGCTHLLLPGVGAFGFCADRLRASGLVDAVRRWAFDEQRPLLGICVGMQLMAAGSEESPGSAGLDWLGGAVQRILPAEGVRVPHVGWNSVEFHQPYGKFAAGEAADFYFDHSFAYGEPREGEVVGSCIHSQEFSAVIRRGNLVAAQFHPEKSQTAGLKFLGGFLQQ